MKVIDRIKDLFGLQKVNKEATGNSSRRTNKVSKLRNKGMGIDISTNRDDFLEPDFDLDEITTAYNTESYVRQALDKYVDLLFKEGWKFKSKDPQATEYIKSRFKMMSLMTNTPIDQFFLEIAEDLVRYSNVFIYKSRARKSEQLPDGNIQGIDGKDPIGGYFLLNPTTVTIARDENGRVLRYQQAVQGEDDVEFSPDEIIHIYYKKDRGKAFGTPFLVPVINDIKALREAEENVLRLIYQHIFPLYQYQVGLAEPGFEASDKEIEEIKEEIENMPLDGGLVTPERHNIKAIGAEGHSLRAESYLQYFERRIFTGLGVSEVQMGRGGTANRATSDTLATEMHDRIRAIQRVLSIFITEFMINELLVEGGFDPIGNEEHKVEFTFEDIELESKIKKETHAIFKYEHNAITEDEMRYEIGEDPISDEEREKLWLNTVTIPKELVGQSAGESGENNSADNSNQPQNQHGKKSGPNRRGQTQDHEIQEQNVRRMGNKPEARTKYKERLEYHWNLTQEDVINMIKHFLATGQDISELNPRSLKTIIHLTKTSMQEVGKKHNRNLFIEGTKRAGRDLGHKNLNINHSRYLYRLYNGNTQTVKRLMDDLHKNLVKAIKNSNPDEVVSKIIGVFQSLEYRLDFMSRFETNKAVNYGYAVMTKELGGNTVEIDPGEKEDCSFCEYIDSFTIEIGDSIYSKIPPYHPNCPVSLSANKGGAQGGQKDT